MSKMNIDDMSIEEIFINGRLKVLDDWVNKRAVYLAQVNEAIEWALNELTSKYPDLKPDIAEERCKDTEDMF